MATVTVYTAQRMAEIEDATVVSGDIVDDELILTKHDGSTIDAGPINILTSPNGTKYRLIVSNGGIVTTVLA